MVDGKLIEEKKEVLKQIKLFYEKLYTTKGPSQLNYLDKIELPTLSMEDQQELENTITVAELGRALNKLPNDKTPGTDGLTSNFYKMFWGKLKETYHNVIMEVILDGEFYLTAKYGILSLLEKIGKDGLLLKNWRPLTLLNIDNKIYTKTVSERAQKVMAKIIDHTQTGFMKGRYMAENIIKIMQVMEYCESQSHDALLVSFDFEKAFNTVEWQALYSSLEKFNFGPRFIHMVKIIFTNPLVCASNNGYWSEFFVPTRGCRQGCCYSPSGFNIVAEILGCAICQNTNIKGIKIGESEITIGQFADDLWQPCFLTKRTWIIF